MKTKNDNTRMAKPKRIVKGIVVETAGPVIRLRKKPRGTYSKTFRHKAIKMYIDGAGLRRTGRQLGIHHQSVAIWEKEQGERLPEPPVPPVVKEHSLYGWSSEQRTLKMFF